MNYSENELAATIRPAAFHAAHYAIIQQEEVNISY